MAILEATKCFVCEVPLSGGADTFGPADRQVCQSCFLSGAVTEEEQEDEEEEQIRKLKYELEDLQSELEEIKHEISEKKSELRGLIEDRNTTKKQVVKVKSDLEALGFYLMDGEI